MNHPVPPTRADALLERVLPAGTKGLTILADLHLEFEDVFETRGEAAARRWYWREAIGLASHYGIRAAFRALTSRDGRGGEVMSTILSDMKFGLRMLVKTPGLSFVAVFTIALGVGLTTHTYSSVYGSVIRGIVVPGADRLMMLHESDARRGVQQSSIPLNDYLDLSEQQAAFEELAAFYQGTVNLAGEDGPPERYQGAFVSANALRVVGIEPILGRVFIDGEDENGAAPKLVLSHHVWQNRFAGAPDILGRVVRANGEAAEIIGVMPEGFRFPFLEDMWIPHRLDPDGGARRRAFVDVFGRLNPGTSMEAAQASLSAVAANLAAVYPDDNEGIDIRTQPYTERFMPAQITAVMYLMLFATFGVLLIACANVTNLLLARAMIRSKEVAIRTAMGASRSRVIRQLLSEALVLAAVGGIIGVGLAYGGVELFNAAILDIQKPYWIDVRVDARALSFALGVTLLASIAAGTVPALRASGFGMGEILKDESRGSSSLRLGRFGTALVVGEIAVSCGLLITAGLMVKSITNLKTMDMGFVAEGVLGGRVGLFATDYPDRQARRGFFEQLEQGLETQTGVESASLALWAPGLGSSNWAATVEGETYATDLDYPVVNGNVVTSGFFETIGVGFVRGRDFTPGEVWDTSDPLAIVNESFVRRVLGERDPLGTRIRLGREGSQFPFARIVGVVPDLHVGGGVGGIGDDQIDPAQMYFTPGTIDVAFMTVLMRSQGSASALAPGLRSTVGDLDPNLPVYLMAPLPEMLQQATWAFGLFGSLFTIFGIAALFMAAVGLYGVMAFTVNQRRQEMGVRIALGASSKEIMQLVLKRGVVQLAVGMTLGLGIGYALSMPLAVVTFDISLTDPTVYASIIGTLAVTGLIACVVPARRATQSDPVEAIRP